MYLVLVPFLEWISKKKQLWNGTHDRLMEGMEHGMRFLNTRMKSCNGFGREDRSCNGGIGVGLYAMCSRPRFIVEMAKDLSYGTHYMFGMRPPHLMSHCKCVVLPFVGSIQFVLHRAKINMERSLAKSWDPDSFDKELAKCHKGTRCAFISSLQPCQGRVRTRCGTFVTVLGARFIRWKRVHGRCSHRVQ